jgi:hypothetical protein
MKDLEVKTSLSTEFLKERRRKEESSFIPETEVFYFAPAGAKEEE